MANELLAMLRRDNVSPNVLQEIETSAEPSLVVATPFVGKGMEMAKPQQPCIPFESMNALRFQTLHGARLADLTDRHGKWVWRSLLKEVRRAETMALDNLSDE
ncbi:MAG: hypothetical protein H0X24_11365 [Ktedonobacterales bacterium]|nr:hypothetical protein [Ktedonobacterales bacterium]